ncbi:MAG: alpha-D-ribose 1-methylphosphonate 5-triphosphate diphosphatase [Bosea sp. (in: a-proteobacteria)]
MTDITIIENAQLVTADDVFTGWVAVKDGLIAEIGHGHAPERGMNLGGDYLLPGLIEIHTDNLEAHFVPRPKVEWHITSAVLSYDAQIASAGITTVFDSLRIGFNDDEARAACGGKTMELADALAANAEAGFLRADHLMHLRCEVPSPGVVASLEEFITRHPVHLISLMDHTPGQRQFRDIEKYFIYYGGKTGKTDAEIRSLVLHRQQHGKSHSDANRPEIVALAHRHAVPLASHDDTTLEEVRQSISEGVKIAEFPTTLEAALASREAGLATVMGAPNVVRGGSHSGNVAAAELAQNGALDVLSSDYVPASLLLAAFQLKEATGMGGLPGAIRLVTKNPAIATGLADRGEIALGLRADLVRVHNAGGHPIVREVWRMGTRVA